MRGPGIGIVAALLMSRAASAQESRFAVVDISPEGRNEKATAELEREVVRLRPGSKPLDDQVMRRLLATGEGPTAAATRLTKEAQERMAASDCAGAIERATQAETLTLTAVALDDERELLRNQYTVLVVCENERGRTAERDAAARRLRNLVSLPPPGMPSEVWQKHVVNATAPPATTEIHVDSDPANGQIAINFHGEGVTPHTLKVPPGTVYVEVQKDGYLKAFRKLQVGTQPMRTTFRLIERTHDRLDQALATANLLRKADPAAKPSASALSRLAQLSRAEMLVLLSVKGNQAKIWFFDAEKGALSAEAINSPVDLATGKLAALASRAGSAPVATPAPAPAPAPTSAPTPATSPTAEPPTAPAAPPKIVTDETPPDPLVAAPPPPLAPKRRKTGAPWWSWLIAGTIASGLLVFVYLDRPQKEGSLAVRAYWAPPQSP